MKVAKSISIILICLLFGSINLSAQIALELDSIFTKVINSSDIPGYNTLTNDSEEEQTYLWSRNVIENTEGWTYGICDTITCYAPFVDSSSFTLKPDEDSRLDVHLYPNMIYSGYSLVEMKVELADDPNFTSFSYYIFDSRITSTSNPEKLDFEIYPNPSQGLFTFKLKNEKATQLTVFDTFGRLIEQMAIGQNQLINLTKLDSGTYLFQLKNEDGQISETKLVTKI